MVIKKEEPSKTDKSSQVYDNKSSSSEYRYVGKYFSLSFTTKHDRLCLFYNRWNDYRNFVPRTEKTNIKKKIVYNHAEKLYNTLLSIYFNY